MRKDSLLIGRPMRKIFFFIAMTGLISCAEKVVDPPADLIPKNKMIDVLYDLALLNSASSTNPQALNDREIEVMPYLFEKHGIDSLQFVESDFYYASVPLEYEDMYMKIKARLEDKIKEIDEARKRKSESAREKSKKRKDSLKNASGEIKKPVLLRKQ